MILVDSSVWISHIRDTRSVAVGKLRALEDTEEILVGDLILLEVLQGARSEAHAARIEAAMRAFPLATLLDGDFAVLASRNYRALRDRGITVRKTADVVIATFCIENGHELLHEDRDFVPFTKHLGLRVF